MILDFPAQANMQATDYDQISVNAGHMMFV